MKRILIFIIALSLTACAGGQRTIKKVDADGKQTVTNTNKLSQSTLRYQAKTIMAKALCTLQSDNHNEQRIVSKSSPVVIVDGKAVAMPESAATVFYNPSIAPFNMIGCIEESMRWGGERLVSQVIGATASLLKTGAIGYAAVKIADKITDNAGVKVSNIAQGATVGIGTDNAPVTIEQGGNDSTECVVDDEGDESCDDISEICVDEDDDGIVDDSANYTVEQCLADLESI